MEFLQFVLALPWFVLGCLVGLPFLVSRIDKALASATFILGLATVAAAYFMG